ncbi:MAG: hypothetical protein ABR514_04340 [Chthoniobacterales bacterium]
MKLGLDGKVITLKRFFRLGYVAGAIFEAGEFLEEGDGDFADRTVAEEMIYARCRAQVEESELL